VFGLALAALTFTACSDTWDDHYEGVSDGVIQGSLWQAIEKDGNLSNFATVLKACGFDKSLASSQVFTVFAPTNDQFTAEEAAALIANYNAEKGLVSEEDNTIIKEFVKNHIAMYAHSVAPGVTDSLLLMNGKRVLFSEDNIAGTAIQSGKSNRHYENGVLFVIDKQIEYRPNVFEYLRKDSELDSLRSFLYNSHFYRKEFEPSLSVPGGIENGKTIYLDSVFSQVNELFYSEFLDARLTDEDSTYWMVAPTNEVWRQLIQEYEPYFNYHPTTTDRDSFAYTFPRLAITAGTIFSETLNREVALQDSARSTLAVIGDRREGKWGLPFLRYYQYGTRASRGVQKPLASGGVLADTRDVECTNGIVKKADKWNFNPLNTFKKVIAIPATSRSAIQEMSKEKNETSKELEEVITLAALDVPSSSPYYGKIWGNRFMQFRPKVTKNVFFRFNLTNVLSNMGYDVYMVTAPILANDSNATDIQRLPTKFTAHMCFLNESGKRDSTLLVEKQRVNTDIVDYILLAEDYKFPFCTYGLYESTPQVSLRIATDVSQTEYRRTTFTRTMNIAYILLVPHGTSWTDEQNFYIAPHGDGETITMSKCTELLNLDEQEQ
jgi:uncharacterized surface protein with fasciclin (FAS1) repeats